MHNSNTYHHIRSIAAAIAVCLTVGAVVSCDSRDPSSPAEIADVSILVDSAALDVAEGDTVVLKATVVDSDGNEIQGARVQWTSANPDIAEVTPEGRLTAKEAGQVELTASALGSFRDFWARIRSMPRSISIASGDGQQAAAGAALGEPITVLVVDRKDAPAVGVPVAFTVTSGEGSVSASSAVTGADGRVSAGWTLGTPGEQSVEARVHPDYARRMSRSSVAFTAVAQETGTQPPPVTCGRVTIAVPADTVLEIGASMTLQAVARNTEGSVIEDAVIQWSSSNPEIMTVDNMGRLVARAAGAVLITAAAAGCTSDTQQMVVEPPPVEAQNPAAVTDLAVADVSTSAVTLRWTAVSDGNGGVAKYAVRYGSPTLDWGSAYETEVSVDAGAVGQEVTYTYTGLEDDTHYQFRLVSYRGTLNQSAVFGGYSNSVAAETEAEQGTDPDPNPPPAPPQVASVTATPASHTFAEVGQSLQIQATARDANGNVVSDADLAWSSTNSSIVSVSSMGLMTARAAGSAMIIVTSVCCGAADSVTVTVQGQQQPPPPPSSGNALFTDDFESYAVGSRLDGRGANGFRWTGAHDGVYVSSDIARSGNRSLKAEYAPYEPGNPSHTHWWAERNFNLGTTVPELWIEFYIYHLNGDEGLGAAFVRTQNSPTKMMTVWSPSGDGYNNAFHTYEYWGRTNGNYARMLVNVSGGSGPSYRPGGEVPLPATDQRGSWIRFRMHAKWSSAPGVADGIARAWVNDRLVMSHTNLQHHPQGGSSRGYQNGYLFGYDNEGFAAYTAVYLDDIRVYTSNPGW